MRVPQAGIEPTTGTHRPGAEYLSAVQRAALGAYVRYEKQLHEFNQRGHISFNIDSLPSAKKLIRYTEIGSTIHL